MAFTLSGDAATTRTNLGLGDAATKTTGTAAGNIPVLDSSGKIGDAQIAALSVSKLSGVGTSGQVLTSTGTTTAPTMQDAASSMEVFSTSLDAPGSVANEAIVGNHYLTFTPSYNCKLRVGWEYSYRHTTSTHAYFGPSLYNSSGVKMADLTTFGRNVDDNPGLNTGLGGVVEYWSDLVGGTTYKIGIFAVDLGASVDQANTNGRDLHITAFCTEV